MNIAIIGYGRMGKAIEAIATERGHHIAYINNGTPLDQSALASCDVAIEFSRPEVAFENITSLLKLGVPVVSGTTGWLAQKEKAEETAKKSKTGFIYASNFSLGVNLFFIANEQLAKIMSAHNAYAPKVHEIHHTGKKDAPSGTAITSAEGILASYEALNGWSMDGAQNALPISAEREDPYCGTHVVSYESAIDTITLTHEAHNRTGFALGAVVAAEWLPGKEGSFGMRDVLGL
ncbi:MAG: 4-hydroxy-tetrahydrodipicolinate reductase [Cryomorphaceae bacterium]|nr:MAG: 4-hydroxy-tetrahydrodipicolinate reductase [Cryomorphaceae bacterium]